MRRFQLDLSSALLIVLAAMALIANLGFCLGVGVSRWLFWIVCFGMGCLLAFESWRLCLQYVCLLAGIVLATAFTYSYFGTDAMGCWLPMQRLMQHGWNPVWEYDIGSILRYAGGAGLSAHHILVYPKLPSTIAAVVGKGLGFFAADSFLSYALLFVLWNSASSFAKSLWNANSVAAHIFAGGMGITTKIVGILGGYVDFSVYALFLIAALSLYRMCHDLSLKNWVMFALAEFLSFGIKGNAILNATILMVFSVFYIPREQRKRMCFLCGGILVLALFINLNPLIPIVDKFFVHQQEWTNITSDFTGNSDALRLGYFWRIVYAWISSSIVPGHPVFHVVGGVGGFGPLFRVALCCSAIVIFFTKRNYVWVLVILIFVSSNALPLKYIGYSRYCPQMWAVPILIAFNFIFTPITRLAKVRFIAYVRYSVLAAIFMHTLGLTIRGAYKWTFFRNLGVAFQTACEEMNEVGGKFVLASNFVHKGEAYFLLERLREEGLDLVCKKQETNEVRIAVSFDPEKRMLFLPEKRMAQRDMK